MRRAILAFAFVFLTAVARADCDGPTIVIKAAETSAAFKPAEVPNLDVGDPVKITVGKTEFETKVKTKFSDFGPVTFVFDTPAGIKVENGIVVLDASLDADTATLVYTDRGTNEEKSVDLCFVGQVNRNFQSVQVGPAVAEGEDEDTADGRPGALRLQYERSLRRFRAVRPDQKIGSARNMEQEFSVSIDTTDQKGEGFVDDNRLRAGLFSPSVNVGGILNRLRLGAAGQIARTLHGGDHNADLTLTLDAGIPLIQSITAFSKQRYLAPPLHLRLSAGQRWQNVDDVNSSGPVAEIALVYHAYAFDDYRLDLEYQTLFNDVEHRPASTPRTQHTWKAAILYAPDVDTPFTAVASFEHGHSGPVFTDIRQFFVGVGIKNLFSRFAPQQ